MTRFDDMPRVATNRSSISETHHRDKAIDGLEALADFLDTRWKIPGTSIHFGVDALAGLVPVVGDAATGLISAYIILRARNHGAGNGLIARMIGNVVLDTVVGSIPILGSIFDVYFKSNRRNIRLLRHHLARLPRSAVVQMEESERGSTRGVPVPSNDRGSNKRSTTLR